MLKFPWPADPGGRKSHSGDHHGCGSFSLHGRTVPVWRRRLLSVAQAAPPQPAPAPDPVQALINM